jgi:hypothetical protein
MIFIISKRAMKSMYIFGILIVGFVVYFFIKDSVFIQSSTTLKDETFETQLNPAPASIEIRKAPIYPARTIMPSGPSTASQEAPEGETIVYGEPSPTDHYSENQESSDIPENLRHPERSFRPPPLNNNTSIAVESGVASNNIQVTSDNSQQMRTEFIQGGGEFMPGIYANDTFSDVSYSAF